jgi:hypothetical protein
MARWNAGETPRWRRRAGRMSTTTPFAPVHVEIDDDEEVHEPLTPR